MSESKGYPAILSCENDIRWSITLSLTHSIYIVLKLFNQANSPQAPPFYVTVSFPWREDSLHHLWGGQLIDEDNPEKLQTQANWTKTVKEWEGTTLVGSNGGVYVFPRFATKKPIFVRLCDASALNLVPNSCS